VREILGAGEQGDARATSGGRRDETELAAASEINGELSKRGPRSAALGVVCDMKPQRNQY